MAVNGRRRYRFRGRRRKTPTQELAGRLAPLEEQQPEGETLQPVNGGKPSGGDDTIRVDTAALKVPKKLAEDEREGADIFRPDKIVIVIVLLMLAFIAFIAWQVSQMPAK